MTVFHWEKNFLCPERDLNPRPTDYAICESICDPPGGGGGGGGKTKRDGFFQLKQHWLASQKQEFDYIFIYFS